MGHIILPRSAGLVKPAGGLGVRWGHPLADRLLWAVAPGLGVSGDLIEGQPGALLGTGTWGGQTEIGAALDSANSTNDGAYWPWTDRLASLTNQWTIVVWADPTTLVSYSSLLRIPYRAAGWTSPYHSLVLGRSALTSSIEMQFATSSTTRETIISAVGAIADTDPLTMYAATRNGTVVRFFRNATQHGGDAATVATVVDISGKQPPTLLNRSSTSVGEGMVGRSPLAAIWGRALTDGEIAWLAAEPYAFVAAPGRRLFVAPIGTAAALAGTVAGVSATTGTLTTSIPLAGVTAGQSAASGALTTGIPLAGAVSAAASVAGSLTTGAGLAGGVGAAGTATGTLTTAIVLVGSTAGVATATGNLTGGAPMGLASQVNAVATVSGSLTTGIPLVGTIAAVPALIAFGMKPAIGHASGRATVGIASILRPGTGHGDHAPMPGVGLARPAPGIPAETEP